MRGIGRSAARLAVGALALAAVSCSGATWRHPRTAQAPPDEVAELKARVLELQRQAAVTQVELERLRQEVARLQARVGGGGAPPAASGGAAGAPSDHSATGRSAPTFEVEELADGTPGNGRTAAAGAVSSPPPTPPQAVEEPVPPAAPAPRHAPAQTPPVPSASAPGEASAAGSGAGGEVTAAAQALYDRGYTQYHQGRYVDAEASFQRFIQSYPATELTDNAQYWIGECRLARGDTKGALAAFRETAERYPQGNKVPDALLKAGESMASLGDVEGARKAYQAVKKRFPGTTAAAVADDRLAALP